MALIGTLFRRVYFHLRGKWKEIERNAGERRVDNEDSNNSTHVVILSTSIYMYPLRLCYVCQNQIELV